VAQEIDNSVCGLCVLVNSSCLILCPIRELTFPRESRVSTMLGADHEDNQLRGTPQLEANRLFGAFVPFCAFDGVARMTLAGLPGNMQPISEGLVPVPP
jgi:hypothetical protein